jgi:hypothetical protein
LLDRLSAHVLDSSEGNLLAGAAEVAWLTRVSEVQNRGPLLLSGVGSPLADQLAERWSGRRFDQASIVTGSSDEDGEVLLWLNKTFGVTHFRLLVDPTMVRFNPERLAALPFEVDVLSLRQPRCVHAKLYWFDGPTGSSAVMGSANCSKAAWLLNGDRGGNVELVTVYDDAPPETFGFLLEQFSEDNARSVTLAVTTHSDRPSRKTNSCRYRVKRITWESSTGELKIEFVGTPPETAKVLLTYDDQDLECRPGPTQDSWSSSTMNLFTTWTSPFAEVAITSADLDFTQKQLHWIDDLSQLRHAAGGWRIPATLRGLGRPATPSEQRQIVNDLHRIGAAILTDMSLFSDPFSSSSLADQGDDPPVEEQAASGPVDPEELIRSVKDLNEEMQNGVTRGDLRGVSLTGVLRAFFNLGDDVSFDEPSDEGDEEETASLTPQHSSQKKGSRKTDTTASSKKRLQKQVHEFLEELRQPRFADSCSATQMVHAATYPLSISFIGLTRNWLEPKMAEHWVTRVFDILFTESISKPSVGLLELVKLRYTNSGNKEVFTRTVGDGSLWAAMLLSLWKLPWSDPESRFGRLLALRSAFRSKDLLASTDPGKLRVLVETVEWRQAFESVSRTAPLVIENLDSLESELEATWSSRISKQNRRQVKHSRGNLLWREGVGWAVASGKTLDGKTPVYLHAKASDIVVRADYYLNVTRLPELESTVRLMERLVTSDRD